jgi:hypothetical protein
MPKGNHRPDFTNERLRQSPNRQAQEKLDDSRGRPLRGGEKSASSREKTENAPEKRDDFDPEQD